ncbi:MAG: hypothetical protein KC502_14120 [Myxococcales bacterium]|nr:hypothetical protein [Myxococcales bacterium]
MSVRVIVWVVVLLGLWGCASPEKSATTRDDVDASANSDSATADVPQFDTCAQPQDLCDGSCLPPCPAGSDRGNGCHCWASPIALPKAGTAVGATACVSAFIPSGNGAAANHQRTAFFGAMETLGVRVIRQHFLWYTIQPTKETWSWGPSDRVVAAAKAANVQIVGLLVSGTPWASEQGAAKNDHYYPPDDPADFANFAAAVVKRYGKTVHRWEIWNEQNAGYRFWKGGEGLAGDAKAYGELLVATYAAIKQVQPEAQVSYGGLFYYPQFIPGAEEFLSDSMSLAKGASAAFDALSFHPYPPYPPVLSPEDATTPGADGMARFAFDAMVDRLSAVLGKAGVKDRPIWVTEIGWPIGLGLTEDRVAQFLVRGYALLLRAGTELLCWYTFMDHSPNHAPVVPWEGVFGLYNWSNIAKADTKLSPKLTALAHGTFFKLLADAKFAADERSGRDWHQLAFASPDGRTIRLLWDWTLPPGKQRTVSFPAEKGRSYTGLGMYGMPHPLSHTAPHAVTLAISATPVYVISKSL